MHSGRVLTAGIAGAIVFASGAANADIIKSVSANGALVDSLSWYSTAANQSPSTITGDGKNDNTGPVTVNDVSGNVSSTYSFGDSFNSPDGSFAASNQIQGQNPAPENYGFVDTYVINLPNSITSAYVFSLNLNYSLGLQNLTARLFDYSANGVQNLTIGATTGVSGLIQAWTVSDNGTIATTQLDATGVPMGEYVLQIAGIETGTTSGMYSGQLGVTPVPLPAALPLLLSGVGTLGLGLRRRRRAA
jgi:hypothetical protein